MSELDGLARDIIDTNGYMVLGTADESGRPWVSPVWFAPDGYADLYWISTLDATHSRNLASRPELSIVIFDSKVPIDTGQGVYMSATARQVDDGAELEHGMEVFSRRSLRQGGRAFSPDDVRTPAPHRLFRATVSEHWVLDPDHTPVRRVTVHPTAS